MKKVTVNNIQELKKALDVPDVKGTTGDYNRHMFFYPNGVNEQGYEIVYLSDHDAILLPNSILVSGNVECHFTKDNTISYRHLLYFGFDYAIDVITLTDNYSESINKAYTLK